MTKKILIKREIFPHIIGHLTKGEVTVITGARQTGVANRSNGNSLESY